MDRLRDYFSNIKGEITAKIKTRNVKKIRQIPYFWQIEKVDSGLISPEDYEVWVHHTCGMACLKMILAAIYREKTFKTMDLVQKSLEYGVYKLNENETDPKKKAEGAFYKEFKNFVENEFLLKVEIARILSIRRIIHEIAKDSYVIASVNSEIKDTSRPITRSLKGGHLVLITGYDKLSRKLILHNSSGIQGKSQENYEISFKMFKKYFAYRGLIVFK